MYYCSLHYTPLLAYGACVWVDGLVRVVDTCGSIRAGKVSLLESCLIILFFIQQKNGVFFYCQIATWNTASDSSRRT